MIPYSFGVTVLNTNTNTIWYYGYTTDSIESHNPANFTFGSEPVTLFVLGVYFHLNKLEWHTNISGCVMGCSWFRTFSLNFTSFIRLHLFRLCLYLNSFLLWMVFFSLGNIVEKVSFRQRPQQRLQRRDYDHNRP